MIFENSIKIAELFGRLKDPGVYCIYNQRMNRYYIGETSNPIIYRISQHFSALEAGTHKNRHMQQDFNRTGNEFYTVSVLQAMPGATKKELLEREKFFINEYYSRNLLNIQRMA